MPVVLFDGDTLQQWLEGELQNRARNAIRSAHHDYLMTQPRERQIEDFLNDVKIRPVVLDAVTRIDWETEVRKGQRVTLVRFSLPCRGSIRILQLRPIEHKTGGVTVDAVYAEAIEFIVETTAADPNLVEAEVDKIVGNIA